MTPERRQGYHEDAEFLRGFDPKSLKPEGVRFIELEAALTEAEERIARAKDLLSIAVQDYWNYADHHKAVALLNELEGR